MTFPFDKLVIRTDTESGRNAEIGKSGLGNLLDQLLARLAVDGFGQEGMEDRSPRVQRLDVFLVFDGLENVPGGIDIELGGIGEERIFFRPRSDDVVVFLPVQPGQPVGSGLGRSGLEVVQIPGFFLESPAWSPA